MEDPDDWIIDSNGFYVATRSFLIRRGYCCGEPVPQLPLYQLAQLTDMETAAGRGGTRY